MKLVFLDIDGTLTEPGGNTPPDSAIEAITTTRKKGNQVFLCTGRNQGMTSPLMKYGFDGMILSSGGRIICGDEVVYDCPMTKKQRIRVITSLDTHGVYKTVECCFDSYTDESFKEYLSQSTDDKSTELLRWRRQLETNLNILPMSEYKDEPVYKIVVMSPTVEQLYAARKDWSDDFNLVIQEPDGFGIVNAEIMNKEFDKGRAIKRICEYLHVDISDTYGFGDSMNDRELFEAVGVSVCMENGAGAMKKMADMICPAVSEDGIKKSFIDLELI